MAFAWNGRSTLFGGAFLFFFLLSLVLFLALSNRQQEVVLFFPNDLNHRLTGEVRIMPKYASLEENVRELVNGLILGPEQLKHERALAKDTRIRSLMIRGDRLYLDFSPGILFPQGDTTAGFVESLDAVRESIRFNFPEIKRIIITVDGQLPKSETAANT